MEESFRPENLCLEELSKEELKYNVDVGLFYKVKNHKEHFAIHPFWLTRPETGVLEEVNKTLGKWNSRLEAYVVAYEKVRSGTTLAAINEDHRWLHVDILLTFYLYKPEEGQQLKGIVKKIGNHAVICSLFNVFSATVFPEDVNELQGWSIGDELEFVIYSFQNRRKGPIIRARVVGGFKSKSVQEDWLEEDNTNKNIDEVEDWEDTPVDLHEVPSMTESSPSKKKKKDKGSNVLDNTEYPPNDFSEVEEVSPKKKKKKRDKSRLSEDFGETEYPIELPEEEELSPKKKKKKRIKEELGLDYTAEYEVVQELISSPKKKHKHKKHKSDD